MSSGVRKVLAHLPAVVTDVSWPSLAAGMLKGIDVGIRGGMATHVGGYEHPLGKLVGC